MALTARALLPFSALLAACTPVGLAGPGPAPGPTAVLTLGAAAAPYALQAAVHRWVAADVFAYEVELKRRDDGGTTFSAFDGGVRVTVNVGGATPATKAVFRNLTHGAFYRAFVTAKGNAGGTAATTVLNATPATADFDFTGEQDVEATVSREVTVVFDGVPFQGTGTLTFGQPDPAPYVNPSDAPTVTNQ